MLGGGGLRLSDPTACIFSCNLLLSRFKKDSASSPLLLYCLYYEDLWFTCCMKSAMQIHFDSTIDWLKSRFYRNCRSESTHLNAKAGQSLLHILVRERNKEKSPEMNTVLGKSHSRWWNDFLPPLSQVCLGPRPLLDLPANKNTGVNTKHLKPLLRHTFTKTGTEAPLTVSPLKPGGPLSPCNETKLEGQEADKVLTNLKQT